jgi:MFS family permease
MSAKTRWLLLLCTVQLFIMMVFINYSAVLPQLKDEWGMNNTMAGSILSVYQLGYIASGVILSALTDRLNTRNIFIASALWSASANLLFALYAHDYTSALILRALTGIGMGGTYMPGIKLVAERFEAKERGRAIGIYVGSLMLGASLSLALTGWLSSLFGWRNAFLAGSACVYLGSALALLAFRGYRPTVHSRAAAAVPAGNAAPARTGLTAETLGNRPALLMILGYASHMWEMYGMRGWIAPFFTASLIAHGLSRGVAPGWAATAAALVIGVGAISTALTGSLSDRLGRTRTISIVMAGSACCSFGFGWLINCHPAYALCFGLVYGFLVSAESPVFSTALTELVSPAYLGAAMGMQSLIGYTLAMVAPTVFGWALDLTHNLQPWGWFRVDWGIAFATAGLGGIAGPVFMYLLRRLPESAKLAGGRK